MFVEGGDSCSTFDSMKNSKKKLSFSKDFPLENMQAKEQGGTFEVVGRLYQRLYSLPKEDGRCQRAGIKVWRFLYEPVLSSEEDLEIKDFEFEKMLRRALIIQQF